jgi:hypothetical protein
MILASLYFIEMNEVGIALVLLCLLDLVAVADFLFYHKPIKTQ